MDGGHLGLSDNSFDVAASVNGVTLFPDVSAGIAKMVRVTKPGGRVVVVCFAHGIEYAEFVTFLFAALRTAAQLTTRQRAYVRQVIDGMLRERSGGSPGAVLRNPMNIAVGIKR